MPASCGALVMKPLDAMTKEIHIEIRKSTQKAMLHYGVRVRDDPINNY